MAFMLDQWLENRSLNPFRELSRIDEPFERLFNEMTNMKRAAAARDFNFTPSCEISDLGNAYMFKFDLPGVSKDHVKVEIDKDTFTVRAERKEEKKSESKKKYLSEVYYGSYMRSFSLPGPVDEKKIDAKFEDGVLTVTVSKSETSKTKQIPVH